jgi:hypothetical protein
MPGNRFIKSLNLNDGPDSFFLEPGKYLGLLCSIETTATSQLALDDLGQISIERNGRSLHPNIPVEYYHLWNRENGHVVEQTLPSSGATRVVFFIPFAYPEAPQNVLHVRSTQEVRFEATPDSSTLSSNTSAATDLRIKKVTADAVQEMYELRMRRSTLSFDGAGRDVEQFNESNIVRLVYEDPSDVISSLQIDRNGKKLASSVDDDEINDLDVYFNKPHQEDTALKVVNPLQGPGAQGYQSSSMQYEAEVSGAGDIITTRMIRAASRA